MAELNFRHLYYFWVVAKEGGFARAAERLDMAIQTISAQVKLLEQHFGHQLLKPAGRGVELTHAGRAAFQRAEEIFHVSQLIAGEVASAATAQRVSMTIGLSDGLSKSAAHALLTPVLATPRLRLVCLEGEVDDLMADLALHRLDLVFACHATDKHSDLRLRSERLMSSPVAWYGPRALISAPHVASFPRSLTDIPLLLPTTHSALRGRIDRWFEQHRIVPTIVGEFEDSALLSLFAAQGLGVFPVSTRAASDLAVTASLCRLGACSDLHEDIYGVRSRRGMHHPLVTQIFEAARSV